MASRLELIQHLLVIAFGVVATLTLIFLHKDDKREKLLSKRTELLPPDDEQSIRKETK